MLPVPSPSRPHARLRDLMVHACTNVAADGASDALADDRIAMPFAVQEPLAGPIADMIGRAADVGSSG